MSTQVYVLAHRHDDAKVPAAFPVCRPGGLITARPARGAMSHENAYVRACG
jgi:hypothetical protein